MTCSQDISQLSELMRFTVQLPMQKSCPLQPVLQCWSLSITPTRTTWESVSCSWAIQCCSPWFTTSQWSPYVFLWLKCLASTLSFKSSKRLSVHHHASFETKKHQDGERDDKSELVSFQILLHGNLSGCLYLHPLSMFVRVCTYTCMCIFTIKYLQQGFIDWSSEKNI